MKVLVPYEEQIPTVAMRVLDHGSYRMRAKEIAREMAGHDGTAEAVRRIADLAGESSIEATA